ncbi:bestrophin-4-like isoform X2 [Artemia franciscana]
MTITYASKVATCTGLGVFWKLLFSWRGSIYKLIWPNLFVYVFFWYLIKTVYLLVPDEDFRYHFIKTSMYCNSYSQFIPLTFILGFYVNLVVKRWWEMFQALPGLDNIAIYVSTSIHGQDERSRLLRRTIMRYLNLAYVMVMSNISAPVKKRFPTMKHMLEAGLMNENELEIFEDMASKSKHNKFWMPIAWAGSIISRARKEGRIRDDFAVKTLLDELCKFRSGCATIIGYDWVPIPLVYTQAVTIAVYTYCVSTLCGSQFSFRTYKSDIERLFASEFRSGDASTENSGAFKDHGDTNVIYFPLFDFLQFFFYMGWMKVAESLSNPFGEDDDDFETNFLVDRNLTVTYLVVDDLHQRHPILLKDQYWDSIVPELPYTFASDKYRKDDYLGSAANLSCKSDDLDFVPMEPVVEEGEEADEENGLKPNGEQNGTKPNSRRPSLSGSMTRVSSRPTLRHRVSMISAIARAFGSKGDNVGGSRASLTSNRRNTKRVSRQNSRTTDGTFTRNNTMADEMFRMSGISLNKLDSQGENNIPGKGNASDPIKIQTSDNTASFHIGSDTSAKKMIYSGEDLDIVDADGSPSKRREGRLDSLLEEGSNERKDTIDVQPNEDTTPLIALNTPTSTVTPAMLKLKIENESIKPLKDTPSPTIIDAPLTPQSRRLMSPLSLLIDTVQGSPSTSPPVSPRPSKLGMKPAYKPTRDDDDAIREVELETIVEDESTEELEGKSVANDSESSTPFLITKSESIKSFHSKDEPV